MTEPCLLTIKSAARQLGVQYRQLLEAVNAGHVPYYQIGKSRRLVMLSEVLVSMKHVTKGE